MANARAIVKRRKAVNNIKKITKTMELIATARFRQAQLRAEASGPYADKISALVRDLNAAGANLAHPLAEVRAPIANVALLIITANRGFCGGYNASLQRLGLREIEAVERDAQQLWLEIAGKRGIKFFQYRGITAQRTYTQFDNKPAFAEVEEIAERYMGAYQAGAIDELRVIYTEYLSAGRQRATVLPLLPLKPTAGEAAGGPSVEYEFYPDATSILDELLPISFKIRLFQCFLDATVSEQIARMVAMKSATENAEDMSKRLTRKYNRARQYQITTELSELMGGAEVLKGE